MSYIDTMERASIRSVRRCRYFADGQRDLVRFDVADGADAPRLPRLPPTAALAPISECSRSRA
jgi:hypothetical protein